LTDGPSLRAVVAPTAQWPHLLRLCMDEQGPVVQSLLNPHHPLNQTTVATVMDVLQTLSHEAAHAELDALPAPFCPSASMDPTWIAGANAHWLGPASGHPEQAAFHERFADTYGTMVFLITTSFHPQAIAAVRGMAARRRADDEAFTTAHAALPYASGEPRPRYLYPTAGLLDQVIEHAERWRTLKPEAMRHQALRWASDAWLADVQVRYRADRAQLHQDLAGGNPVYSHLTGQLTTAWLTDRVDTVANILSVTWGEHPVLQAWRLADLVLGETDQRALTAWRSQVAHASNPSARAEALDSPPEAVQEAYLAHMATLYPPADTGMVAALIGQIPILGAPLRSRARRPRR